MSCHHYKLYPQLPSTIETLVHLNYFSMYEDTVKFIDEALDVHIYNSLKFDLLLKAKQSESNSQFS